MNRHRSAAPAVRALGLARLGVGLLAWTRPIAAGRVLGLAPVNADPRAAVVTRLFAAREAALGLALLCPDGTVQHTALRVGLVVDAVDVAGVAVAQREGLPRQGAVLTGGGALLFVALGLAGTVQRRRRTLSRAG